MIHNFYQLWIRIEKSDEEDASLLQCLRSHVKLSKIYSFCHKYCIWKGTFGTHRVGKLISINCKCAVKSVKNT